MRRDLRNKEVLEVVCHDGAGSTDSRRCHHMFIVRVWQVEGAVVWFPIFDQSVVERRRQLANEVTGPRSCGSGWFAPIDQLLCLMKLEFGQDRG